MPDLGVGIHLDIPEAIYHADPFPVSLSSSVAKLLLERSPAHAWTAHPRLNPAWQPDDAPTSEQDFGRALHRMLLEGADEGHGVVVVDANDWRTKDAKELRDGARALGNVPLLRAKYEAAQEIAEALDARLRASELWPVWRDPAAHDTEVTGLWQEPSGVRCRLRADWWSADRDTILDFKFTGTNANPEVVSRQILTMGYDVQASLYTRGAAALTGKAPRFIFVVCETEPPYAVSLLSLPPGWLEIARRKVEYALEEWQRCLAADQWPAYPSRICYPELPAWAETRWMERELATEDQREVMTELSRQVAAQRGAS